MEVLPQRMCKVFVVSVKEVAFCPISSGGGFWSCWIPLHFLAHHTLLIWRAPNWPTKPMSTALTMLTTTNVWICRPFQYYTCFTSKRVTAIEVYELCNASYCAPSSFPRPSCRPCRSTTPFDHSLWLGQQNHGDCPRGLLSSIYVPFIDPKLSFVPLLYRTMTKRQGQETIWFWIYRTITW